MNIKFKSSKATNSAISKEFMVELFHKNRCNWLNADHLVTFKWNNLIRD